MEFINGWYILLIISDMFTIMGSFIKIGIKSKVGCPLPFFVVFLFNFQCSFCFWWLMMSLFGFRLSHHTTCVQSCWGRPLCWCGWESFASWVSFRNTMYVNIVNHKQDHGRGFFFPVCIINLWFSFILSLYLTAFDCDSQSCLFEHHSLLLLCICHLFGILLLWMDCAGTLSCQGSQYILQSANSEV